jgi:hypothetical protein
LLELVAVVVLRTGQEAELQLLEAEVLVVVELEPVQTVQSQA